jgi:hypothetical protein
MGHRAVDWGVVAVFATVYLGKFLGGLPRLKLDRSGVALLGAIAVIALTGLPLEEAAKSVDLPTIVLLFAFMAVSAQMRLGGFYTVLIRRVGAMPLSIHGLLAAIIEVAGVGRLLFKPHRVSCHDTGGGAPVFEAKRGSLGFHDQAGVRRQYRIGRHADR